MAALALAAALLAASTAEASQKKKKHHSQSEEPAVGALVGGAIGSGSGIVVASHSVVAEEHVVQDLIQLMNETKSQQTLLATALALMPMGKKAQAAVPAIIRNAERLKMLLPLKDASSAKAENASLLLTAVMAIQMDLTFTKEMLGIPGENNPLQRYVVPPAPPACYPPVVAPAPPYTPYPTSPTPVSPYGAGVGNCPYNYAGPCPPPLQGCVLQSPAPTCPLSVPPPPAVPTPRPSTRATTAPDNGYLKFKEMLDRERELRREQIFQFYTGSNW